MCVVGMCVNVLIIFKEKEAMDLKVGGYGRGWRKGIREGLPGGRKWKGKEYAIIFYLKCI